MSLVQHITSAHSYSQVSLPLRTLDCKGAGLLFCLSANRSKGFYRLTSGAAYPTVHFSEHSVFNFTVIILLDFYKR